MSLMWYLNLCTPQGPSASELFDGEALADVVFAGLNGKSEVLVRLLSEKAQIV